MSRAPGVVCNSEGAWRWKQRGWSPQGVLREAAPRCVSEYVICSEGMMLLDGSGGWAGLSDALRTVGKDDG
jgi:hypothetical protein